MILDACGEVPAVDVAQVKGARNLVFRDQVWLGILIADVLQSVPSSGELFVVQRWYFALVFVTDLDELILLDAICILKKALICLPCKLIIRVDVINELVQLGRALDGLRDLSPVGELAFRQLNVLVLFECLLDHEAIIISST